MIVRNAKENKAIAKKNENIIHGDLLRKPCSDFYHVGDEVHVQSSEINKDYIRESFTRNGGRFGEVIYAGDSFITVRYEENPAPFGGGYAPIENIQWTESFGRLSLAQGNVMKL